LRDVSGRLFNARLQLPDRVFGGGRIGPFLSLHQTGVVFHRKFRIHRNQDAFRRGITLAGKPDGELDKIAAGFLNPDVLQILIRRQDLFQKRPQLNFAPGAARLDVGEHFFKSPTPAASVRISPSP